MPSAVCVQETLVQPDKRRKLSVHIVTQAAAAPTEAGGPANGATEPEGGCRRGDSSPSAPIGALANGGHEAAQENGGVEESSEGGVTGENGVTAGKQDAALQKQGPIVEVVEDIWEWKRRQGVAA